MTDEELEAQVYEAFLRRGWVFPTTVEEVALVESLTGEQHEGPLVLRGDTGRAL